MNVDEPDDPQLWTAVLAGDGLAFAEVYRRHSSRIYSYCFRRLGSWETAQDLTSLVFLEAWRRRHDLRLDRGNSVLAWLFGIANNVIRNSERAKRRHWHAMASLPAVSLVHDHADEVAARLDAEAKIKRVVECLEAMTTRDREILTLAAWGQLDERQLADALGIPKGTVKSRLSRARSRLDILLDRQSTEQPDVVTQGLQGPRAPRIEVL